MFILMLRDRGVIDQAVFSFLIDVKNDRSKLLLGGYDLENMAAPCQDLTFHPVIQGASHWTLELSEIYIQTDKMHRFDYS